MIWLLAENPEQWTKIRTEPALIPNAFNEALRLESPVRGFCRHVARPVVFENVSLSTSDKVFTLFASANRDERKSADPDTFDVTRQSSHHVAFGHGVHGCPGQGLARMQSHALLGALAKRVERLELISSTGNINKITRAFSSVEVVVSGQSR